MSICPPELAWRVWGSLLAFLWGWGCCALVVRRVAGGARLSLSIAGGLLAWKSAIVVVAVASATGGVFSRSLFAAVPLVLASALAAWSLRRTGDGPRLPRGFGEWLADPASATGAAIVALGLAYFGWFALHFPADAWDTYQYHRTQSMLLLQEGRLWDLPTTNWNTEFYPKNTEIAAAWVLNLAGWDAPARASALADWLAIILAAYAGLRAWGATTGEASLGSTIAVGAPMFVKAVMCDTGDNDAPLAAAFLTGLAALLHLERAKCARVASIAILAAAFCPGVKGTGCLHAACLTALLVVRLAWIRLPRRILPAIALLAGCWLAVSSYWQVSSAIRRGNPFFPVKVSIAGHTVFDGPWDARTINSAGTPEDFRGKSTYRRFRRSVGSFDDSKFVWGNRVGGWGRPFAWFGLWAWVAAPALCLLRRRGWNAVVLAACWGLILVTPNPWKVRFSLALVAATPLAIHQALALLPIARLRRAAIPALACFGLASAAMFAEFARPAFANSSKMKAAAKAAGRKYFIPQDAFRAHWPDSPDRDLYRWLAENTPSGACLGHLGFGDRAGFEYLLYRPDLANTVRAVQSAETGDLTARYDVLVAVATDARLGGLRTAGWKPLWGNEAFEVLGR